MNVLGVGPLELMLVLVIGVIVLGPERLPEVAVQLARAVRYLRGYATNATADIRAELSELTKEYDEVRKELQEFRQSVKKDISSVSDEVDRTLRQSQPIIEPGGEPPPESPNPRHETTP
jgi:sec-independent protein translocase protein TatB